MGALSRKPPADRSGAATIAEYRDLAVSQWGLDWGDISQIRAKLELTPTERLLAAQEVVNAVLRIRAQNASRG